MQAALRAWPGAELALSLSPLPSPAALADAAAALLALADDNGLAHLRGERALVF